MDFVCKLCTKPVRYDSLANIGSDFIEILAKTLAIDDINDLNITHACQVCVNSVRSYYNFKEDLRKNLNISSTVSDRIMTDVREFRSEVQENVSVMHLNECLMLVPTSRAPEMLLLQSSQPPLRQPRVLLERLDISVVVTEDESSDESDDDHFDAIAVKMEPSILINDDSGFSTDTSSKWSLDDLTPREKHYVTTNIQLAKRTSNTQTRTAKCKVCEKRFDSRQKTATHIKRDHLLKRASKLNVWITQKVREGLLKEGSHKYKCVICAKTETNIFFEKAFHLRLHLMEHKKSPNFRMVLEEDAEPHFDATASEYDHPFGFLVS